MKRWIFLAATLVGFLRFGYKYLDLVVIGNRVNVLVPFVEEMTAAYGVAVLIIGFVRLMRRLRTRTLPLQQQFAFHLVGALAFSLSHTTLNWLSRATVFGALGQPYSYGAMPTRYLMELPMDLIVYALFLATMYGAGRLQAAREAELEGARLKGRLLEAQLRSLRTRLEPHFLFNSLNTISSTMYRDPRAADEMIGHLSDLLRSSFESSEQEVTLGSELESLDHYVSLLRARFRDRLACDVHAVASPDAMVPSMILQPLVENAARHGAADGRSIRVHVEVKSLGDELQIDVSDDGLGIANGVDPFAGGIGLGSARERIQLMYGERARFSASNAAEGGFQVRIAIPLRAAPRIEQVSQTSEVSV